MTRNGRREAVKAAARTGKPSRTPSPIFSSEHEGLKQKLILPPEGVPLTFTVATLGERGGAFLLDLIAIGLLLTGVSLCFGLVMSLPDSEFIEQLMAAVLLVVFFLLFNFYFTFFEVRWHGRTIGKRILGIRVIDAAGGQLRADAIIARNLMRDVEWLLPLGIILNPQVLWPGAPASMALVGAGWLVVLALLPAFNSEHRRVGDLVGGTVVVRNPKATLLRDLAIESNVEAATDGFLFTAAQLETYGVFELQVLEQLLRAEKPGAREMAMVAQKICKRITWEGEAPATAQATAEFLRSFYRAQRAHLERKLLLGQRKEHKNAPPSER
ncbi:MAG: RDD family protein [Planctomycetota bacterium]